MKTRHAREIRIGIIAAQLRLYCEHWDLEYYAYEMSEQMYQQSALASYAYDAYRHRHAARLAKRLWRLW